MVACGLHPCSQAAGDFLSWEHAVRFRSLVYPSLFADRLGSLYSPSQGWASESQWILSQRWVCRSATDILQIRKSFPHADVVEET